MDHTYAVRVTWEGDPATGTTGYRDYTRDVRLAADGKPDVAASADRAFHGDAGRWNPEELLVAALAQCHLLSYLHVAVRHGVVVTAYDDAPVGTLRQEGLGGRITRVLLHPRVTVAEAGQVEVAAGLHAEAHELCFIAGSVAFPVVVEPERVTVR